MNHFYEEVRGIYRLEVPFEAIYTSVFLIQAKSGLILVDCATTDRDVDEVIVPALWAMGYAPTDIRAIVLTHAHGDHAGGLARFLSLAPTVEVITDVRALDREIETYPMAGHTEDSIGVLDHRTHTLLSGDGLQGAGVDRYRCAVKDKKAYLETLNRIRNDERIENVLFSHAYEPWDCNRVHGRANVCDCLMKCKEYVKE